MLHIQRIGLFIGVCIFLISLWCTTFYILPLELAYDPTLQYDDEHIKNGIPKRIWTFWNSEVLPSAVTTCVGTWRRHCPEYEIVVLTPETLIFALPNAREILQLPFSDTPQRLADFIRLHVLYLHGGYWLDASILLFQSLDVFGRHQQKHQTEFVGYYLDLFTVDAKFPVIENWFFGCVKNSCFVGHWRNEFMRINQYASAMSYVDHIRLHGIQLGAIPYTMSYYLSMHVAAQVIIQHHKYPMNRCFLQKAEDGPYQYLVMNKWDSKKAIAWIVENVKHGTITTPFIKMRGAERKVFEVSLLAAPDTRIHEETRQ